MSLLLARTMIASAELRRLYCFHAGGAIQRVFRMGGPPLKEVRSCHFAIAFTALALAR